MIYLPRLIDAVLDELIAAVPAVMLVGPRASGKTTSGRHRAATVLQLDRPEIAAVVRADPDGALLEPGEPILIDEWQFVPEVLGAVKRTVDEQPTPSRFLLTGSASADLGPAGWAMTGRVLKLQMWGLSERELAGSSTSSSIVDHLFSGDLTGIELPVEVPDLRSYVRLALRGMLPETALEASERIRARRHAAYIDQLLVRDVALLGDRRDPRMLRRYLQAIGLNTAGTPEHKLLYDSAGIDRRTALVYDSVLQGLFVTESIPAWTSNRLSRLTQLAKRYLTDPAHLGVLAGVDDRAALRNADLLGRLIDTFVLAQLRPELEVCLPGVTIHHLRQENGRREVDLLLEAPDGRVVGIEVKAGAAPDRNDARHLVWLREQLGADFAAGVVFHTGARPFVLDDRIWALPIASIWGTHPSANA